MKILDNYIKQLIENSTPQEPAWNIEKIRAGKPNTWNYIDGCMIKALITFYDITKDERYLQFADEFIDYFVQEDGSIKYYDPKEYNLDNVNAGKTLYCLYNLTGKEKHRKAMDTIYSQLLGQPRTKEGNFWHKEIYPNQIWLDGLYMAQPFYMQYELSFCNGNACMDSFRQFQNVRELMRCERNGLYYHAYDSSREMFWCDKTTGQSAHAWGRAMGWYVMAIVETLQYLGVNDTTRPMIDILNYICEVLPEYADPATGMWYQVLDQPGREGNYLESTASAMFVYAMLKGVRLGYLPAEMGTEARRLYEKFVDRFVKENPDGTISLTDCCSVAGLGGKGMRSGTFEYYISEPVIDNDCKGVGPFIWASLEYSFPAKSRDSGAAVR